mmetsp:Transcript_25897/g.41579  ORF Transcript_25897/g.41579 Transcript_25897/m.41579 type:complete len:633 (-) Transcript_25897:173-2071(-)
MRILFTFAIVHVGSAVKEVFSHKEFQDTQAEAKAAGRPVIVDYYSNSCGPCHMIAPVYKRISREFAGRAYFRKVDVNRNSQTSSAQGIRSMPTFQFWLNGKKVHTFSGADEGQLREWTRRVIEQADREDIIVTREALEIFYKKHDPAKSSAESIDNILEKHSKDFPTMVKVLKKKYGEGPKTSPRPKAQKSAGAKSNSASSEKSNQDQSGAKTSSSKGLTLQTATIEDLRQELERREEEAELDRLDEEERRFANNPCTLYRNRTSEAIEKVVIIGGGPGGMSAAIYAARANLCPLVIAPSLGGQLMAKGVDVENYPGMPRENGGKMIAIMRSQARTFNTEIRDDVVLSLNTEARPFEIMSNRSGLIRAHTIILATGADSRYLHAEGEWELRGNGVSSCATCDGYLFKGKKCVVVGGGDTAMEEALFLSRICSETTIIHRRDAFRASVALQKRVLNNKKISVMWNTTIAKYISTTQSVDGQDRQVLSSVILRGTGANDDLAPADFPVDAVFVAIGHDPNTKIVKGKLQMDDVGYLVVENGSTSTSLPGIFAAGDVADHTYRQAITSAGSGAMAALDVERYLSENLVEDDTCVQQEDFSSWSVKELRAQLKMLGITCAACSEKADFIESLRATY